MPDITMCNGLAGLQVCPLKDKCYRHTAIADGNYQSYFAVVPFKMVDVPGHKNATICKHFWDNEGRK